MLIWVLIKNLMNAFSLDFHFILFKKIDSNCQEIVFKLFIREYLNLCQFKIVFDIIRLLDIIRETIFVFQVMLHK